ncbi:alpha/beta-hydrolase [Dendrothele bispora CBS 962.96]|uniref:Alpha/beta-hydrolase n=1 Tax=Dendrothele bispora (strain CBS 962.96) TaxID=1314807 RepID=A0A4S8MCI8_DENBC|nr:alpha/beta-hydrolase [Dendrothele bispora CBS 962.96]
MSSKSLHVLHGDKPPFNPSLWKNLIVTRGLLYHYYFSPQTSSGKPTLIFLHGFPNSSYDWRHQVSFFQKHGYGLIVPDMLGYGGTEKPVDPKMYASSLVCRDVVDILDKEKVEKGVLIGHDWGSKTVSRLINYYPERFTGFAFLGLGYIPPEAFVLPYTERNTLSKSVLGYENYGYWEFFSSDGADQSIMDNLDSLFDILYAKETVSAIKDFAPLGALEGFIKNGRRTTTAAYVKPEERAIQMDTLRRGGMTGPLNWYKIVTSTSIERDDDQVSPLSSFICRRQLTNFVSCIGIPKEMASVLQYSESDVTVREYNASHWVMMEARDEVNRDLLEWIEGLEDQV